MPAKKGNTIKASSPIGIFDSGIGGLTVANAIIKLLPKEDLIYFGDTAHLPYGEKSPDAIKYYSIRIARFLMQRNCKMIVIACNTASALAYEVVKEFVGGTAHVVNVIDPVVEEVVKTSPLAHLQRKGESTTRKIGVIGTKATIKSDIYAKKINSLHKKAEVVSVATPLLASMIEEGYFNNKISRTIIHSYLSKSKLKKIDSLILACTHYPLIKPEIEEVYKNRVEIIDSAGVVGKHVKNILVKKNLLANHKSPHHHFFISDYTKSFEKSAKYFFKNKIKLEEANIWK